MSLDTQLFLMISSLGGNPFLDQSMLLIAEAALVVVPLITLYVFKKDRRKGILTGFSVPAGVLFTYFMGLFYSHQQPFTVYSTVATDVANNAFPSQHTALAFSAFWSLLWLKQRKEAALVGLTGLAAGFARVYVGYHYPFDILGGIVAGLAGLGFIYLFEKLDQGILDFVVERLP